MTAKRWLQEQEPKWERLEALLSLSQHAMSRLSPKEIREMGMLYRGTVNDLSRAQSNSEFQHLEPYLNNLVQRCHSRIYERPPASGKDVINFFLVEFPRCFRRNFWLIALAFIMFALGSAIAMVTAHTNPETETYFLPQGIITQLDRGILWTDTMQANPSESSFLMTNNIRVAFNAFAFGILFGVGSLLLLFHNGLFAFGGPLQVCIQHGMGFRLVNFMIAHGVIELTTIFIAGGAGMLIGFTLLFPGDLPRWQAVRIKAKEATILIAGCIPLLVIAGIIEGMVSLNRQVDTNVRLIVTAASALFLIAYLGFSGRPRRQLRPLESTQTD
jgi:uncharacterized membrane protein SpoIIM required for sporulation